MACLFLFSRYCVMFTIALACSIAVADEGTDSSLPLGIVVVEPTLGRSVKLDDGTWMVPYQHTIADGTVVFEMIPIPGGTVMIGSPESEPGRRIDEGPQFEVELLPYWIGRTEVTWTEYRIYQLTYKAFKEQERKSEKRLSLRNDVDAVTAPTPIYDEEYTHEFGGTNHPAVTMTQYGAKQYSKWLSITTGIQYRLPTEVEWERACRAGTSTAYSFGDDVTVLSEYAQFEDTNDTGKVGTLPVGSKLPNAFGLHDLHGNVSEWVIDQYAADSYTTLAARSSSHQPAVIFGTELYPHVLRGGGWMNPPEQVRSAVRFATSTDLMDFDADRPRSPHWLASDESRNIGFRLARSFRVESREVIAHFWNAGSEELELDVADRLDAGRGAIGIPEASGQQTPRKPAR